MKYPFLFVALDYKTPEEAINTARQLDLVQGSFGFKVNANIWFNWPPKRIVDLIKGKSARPIFADIKAFLGKRTMSWLAEDFAAIGVDFINIHLRAGEEAVKEVKQTLAGSMTKLLGLTVPTHYDDEYCLADCRRPLLSEVSRLAVVANAACCDGIILPGPTLRPTGIGVDHTYRDMLKVVPGIRIEGLPGFDDKRHADPMTPKKATEDGANILVCGTPITKSEDKPRALQKVLAEMA